MKIDAREIISNATRPVFESVEARQLMSATSFSSNTLTIQTGAGNDRINIELSDDASEITAVVNGERSKPIATRLVSIININAGNGNNRVVLDPRINKQTHVTTGRGNDYVRTGQGNDIINTGAGRDTIDAGAGDDFVYAGPGHDKINGGSGNDTLNGGSGNDSISADGGHDFIYGRKGNDKIYGDRGDILQPDGGKDQVERYQTPMVRNDAHRGPAVQSISIVNADTGAVVRGYEAIRSDTILDPATLPDRYTIVANVDQSAKSVRFETDNSLTRADSAGVYSLTADGDARKFAAWTPVAGTTYTLRVAANTAADLAGLTGDSLVVKLTLKRTASGATTGGSNSGSNGNASQSDAAAPKIKIAALDTTVVAGQGFHIQATGTTVPGHQIEDARFEWDFGDASGKYNKLAGFNAAHVYAKAGKYTVTLTVTAPGGKVSQATYQVNVTASNYRTIYVAANGNDNNDGSSQSKPVRSLTRAAQLVTDDTKVLLRRGDTFGVVGTSIIENDNVVIDTYGVGNSPILKYEGARGAVGSIISIKNTARNVSINGLTFTSIYDRDTDQSGMIHAIVNAGTNITIRSNTFLHVGYGVNNNGRPNGVYIVDNSSPLETGLRGYLSWTEGSNFAIVGNYVANSTREHAIRAVNITNVLIAHNDLTNLDLRDGGDMQDYAKSAINVQRGEYAYIANNKADGVVSIGPLGGGDGKDIKDQRFNHGVIENNTVENASITVQHGTNSVTIRDNVIRRDNGTGIDVIGYNSEYNRGVSDLVIDGNIAVNNGTYGQFLRLHAKADGITLTNNAYVAPKLIQGYYFSAGISVAESNLNSFRSINGNVWPTAARATNSATDGVHVFGTIGYVTASQWNNLPQVGDDESRDVNESTARSIIGSILKAA